MSDQPTTSNQSPVAIRVGLTGVTVTEAGMEMLAEFTTWVAEAWYAKTKATKAKRALQVERNKALQMRVNMLRIWGDQRNAERDEAALKREAEAAEREAAMEVTKVFGAIFSGSDQGAMRPGAFL